MHNRHELLVKGIVGGLIKGGWEEIKTDQSNFRKFQKKQEGRPLQIQYVAEK